MLLCSAECNNYLLYLKYIYLQSIYNKILYLVGEYDSLFIFLRSTRNTTPTTTAAITSSRTPITAPAIAPPLTAGGGQDLYDKSLFKRIDFSSASARCKKAVLLTHLFPVLSGRRHQQNPRCTSTGSYCYIASGKKRESPQIIPPLLVILLSAVPWLVPLRARNQARWYPDQVVN